MKGVVVIEHSSKWYLSSEEKERHIIALTDELPTLRAKAGISQDELAGLIGVSRQTYGAIERRERRMTWSTYLSFIFFFDNNLQTRKIIRSTPAFPKNFLQQISKNDNSAYIDLTEIIDDEHINILDCLDEQALHSIKTMIMIEYARCTNQSGENVVKSFDGLNFVNKSSDNAAVSVALKKIKERGSFNGK